MAEIANKFIDALHRLEESGNLDVITDLFADGAVLSNPQVRHSAAEGNAARTFWSGYLEAFATINSKFSNVVENNGIAMLEWTSKGTVADNPVSYEGVSVIEVRDGKITAFRAYFDPKQLLVNAEQGQGESDAVEARKQDEARDAAELRAGGGYSS